MFSTAIIVLLFYILSCFLLSASEPVNHHVGYAILDGESSFTQRQKMVLLIRSNLICICAVRRSDSLKTISPCFQIVFYVTIRGRFSACCLKWSMQHVELKRKPCCKINTALYSFLYVSECDTKCLKPAWSREDNYCTAFGVFPSLAEIELLFHEWIGVWSLAEAKDVSCLCFPTGC